MANQIYVTGIQHPVRAVRVAAMGCMLHACVLRCLGLFWRELCVLALSLWFLRCSCGVHPLAGLGVMLLVVQVWCWIQAANRKEYVAGHRAGAKGYTGVYVENTIEAMQALIAEDNGPRGPVADLHFVEVDIQETADGELVILHDFHLADAFPRSGPNIQAYRQLYAQLGVGPLYGVSGGLHVKDVTLAQLQLLHLGGREGLRAPTLRAFLSAFRAAGARRPLVVEVKRLRTDAARERLIQLLREYLPFAQQQQQLYPQHAAPGLGFLAIIAFPHYFAASFGELGSPRWALWGNKLATLGIPVSCCFLDSLSYLHGLPTANSATT